MLGRGEEEKRGEMEEREICSENNFGKIRWKGNKTLCYVLPGMIEFEFESCMVAIPKKCPLMRSLVISRVARDYTDYVSEKYSNDGK